jgi:hypothetical protein
MNKQLDQLLTPAAVREQAHRILSLIEKDQGHFKYHPDKLDGVIELVHQVTLKNYPDLQIPFHSRWGHFKVGNIPRLHRLDAQLKEIDPLEAIRVRWDLAITSVLLDAGAGMGWSYYDKESNQNFSKSEGLAVASLDLFYSGVLADDGNAWRADGDALMKLTTEQLNKAFQVSPENPLIGVEGRLQLMHSLGHATKNETYFKTARPGALVDLVLQRTGNSKVISAPVVLRAVLDGLGSIWPGRLKIEDTNLGDVWRHSRFGLTPFHKLSQWMTYSLLVPLSPAYQITDVELLTGLAEYRNGGLILDSGLVTLKDPSELKAQHTPDSDLIIEWRALTVALLDLIGDGLRKKLGKTPAEFPLAKALEGGTWWAGRKLAKEMRADGGPPLNLKSDGTVF